MMVPILVVLLIYLDRPNIICFLDCERLGYAVVLLGLLIFILHDEWSLSILYTIGGPTPIFAVTFRPAFCLDLRCSFINYPRR